MRRLDLAGRIDRSRPLRFTFDGRRYGGFQGDTLASALMANGVSVFARSFKYHRPRGVVGAWMDEPNALVEVGSGARVEPNARATTVELYDGLVARSQGAWPSLGFDLREAQDLASAFLPAGFYYKTFIWPNWKLFEPAIRESAASASAPPEPDDQTYVHRNAHCDVLVIGAGPAGLAAALAAGASGVRVILVDDRPELGGSLAWRGGEIDGQPAAEFVAAAERRLQAMPEVRILRRTQAFGAYDHNLFALIERLGELAEPGAPRQRLWRVRAKRTILATGAIERPLLFANNDRPGVMLASAALEYARRYAVGAGSAPIVLTNNDDGYASALGLLDAGVAVKAVVDVRREAPTEPAARLAAAGVPVYLESAVTSVRGRKRVRAAEIASLAGGPAQSIDTDGVLTAGGWAPTVHLLSQAGGRLRFDEQQACFRPAESHPPLHVAGGANGDFGLHAALSGGWSAGAAAAAETGGEASALAPPAVRETPSSLRLKPFWRTPSGLAKGRQWVDLQNDVTSKDIALAAREGFHSVEHLKRYTTTGMATDQGKTSNVNALAILSEELGREVAETGTTTFRPPYTGVTLGAFAGLHRGALQRPYRYLPTHDAQEAAGAVFVEAGQWLRPDYYPRAGETREAAARREMRTVRNGVGLFEASPLGKLLVCGPDAAKFLDHVYLNNASKLAVGRARYGLMANEHGALLDDGVFLRLEEDVFLVSCSSGAAAHVAATLQEWLQCEWIDWKVTVQPVTTQYATIAVSGPKSRELLASLCRDIALDADSFPHMSLRHGTVADLPAMVARVSFTGELQYEVSVAADQGPELWRTLLEAGAPLGVAPIGAEAWLRMRLEKGYILVGVDSDGATIPDDVGFTQWRRKSIDFVGRRSLLRPEAARADRPRLVGLEGLDPSVTLPVGAQVVARGAQAPTRADGRVTSSCISETLGKSVALALVRNGPDRLGEEVDLIDAHRRYSARIVPLPFYDPQGERLDA